LPPQTAARTPPAPSCPGGPVYGGTGDLRDDQVTNSCSFVFPPSRYIGKRHAKTARPMRRPKRVETSQWWEAFPSQRVRAARSPIQRTRARRHPQPHRPQHPAAKTTSTPTTRCTAPPFALTSKQPRPTFSRSKSNRRRPLDAGDRWPLRLDSSIREATIPVSGAMPSKCMPRRARSSGVLWSGRA
jgi:hypothetical protein